VYPAAHDPALQDARSFSLLGMFSNLPHRSPARWMSLAVAVATVTLTQPADAFCGFYVSGADAKLFNNATQVVLMREGTRTVLSMQNNYQGPAADFAMVVPVPVILQKENVKTLPREVFAKVDQLDAPRLVEYWEQDPCQPMHPHEAKGGGVPRPMVRAGAAPQKRQELGVTVEAEFTVGEYEVVILSAKDAGGLDTWLKQEKYKIPDGSEALFRPYVLAGSKFFVARVDVSKVTFEKDQGTPASAGDASPSAMLSPLRFHYDSVEFSLPVRLGLVNSNGTQDLIVHILAKGQRYEVANYPNATIPTNFDVAENARGKFGPFYAALFDRTLEKNPKAVITEYSWDAGTCDPCPGPALSGNDLATLGADALSSASAAPPPAPSPRTPGMRGPRMGFMPSGFVITRLHARYSKDSLGEDLVFRTAPAIVGGREIRKTPEPTAKDAPSTAEPELEHGATPSTVNNFQGRYAIRHPWGGPIACAAPRRGVWGGPPGNQPPIPGGSGPKAAKDLAFVPRDQKLASFVRSAIPELGVKGEGLAVSPVLPGAANAVPTPTTVPATSPGAAPEASAKRGCLGCMTTPEPVGFAGAIASLLLLTLVGRRRGRRD
jgi:hypothetical protein